MQSDSRVQIVHDLYAPHCHSYPYGWFLLSWIYKIKSCLRIFQILPMIAAELGRYWYWKQFPGESLPPGILLFLTGHLKVVKNSQQKKVITTNHMKYGLWNIHVRIYVIRNKKKEYTLWYTSEGADRPSFLGLILMHKIPHELEWSTKVYTL